MRVTFGGIGDGIFYAKHKNDNNFYIISYNVTISMKHKSRVISGEFIKTFVYSIQQIANESRAVVLS